MSELPVKEQKAEQRVVEFFDNYYNKTLEFPSNEFDAVIGFFTKRGFDKTSAISVGQSLLKQAKLDNVKTFELLDTLKGLEEVQLSRVVTEVLNFQRHKGSTLGFKVDTNIEYFEKRNIVV